MSFQIAFWKNQLYRHFYTVLILCFWHVISQLGIVKFDEISMLEILFSSSCLCSLLAVSVLYFEQKLGIGCVNIQKFINSKPNSFSYEKPRTLSKRKYLAEKNQQLTENHQKNNWPTKKFGYWSANQMFARIKIYKTN